MKVIKEIVKEVLKIFLGIIWILSFWMGYIWMSIPEVMIICFAINTGCVVVLYCGLKKEKHNMQEQEISKEEEKMSKELVRMLEERENENKIQLCTAERGQRIVGTSGRTYIVLKQMPDQEQTVVIADDFMAEDVVFDDDTPNYAESSLKERIERDILPVVEADFGADSLIEHEADLTTVDMQRDFGTCWCKVRPLTFDEAREFNDLLEKEDLPGWYWTCTSWSTEKRGWKYSVAVVSPSGDFDYDSCYYDVGVRPVLYLKSNIFVSKGE